MMQENYINRLPSKYIIHGRYQIQRDISTSSIGTLYKGIDLEFKTPVVIKILYKNTESVSSDVFIQKFYENAELYSSLEHPNINSLLFYGLEDDMPYLVYEYIEGINIANYFYKEFSNWDEQKKWMQQIATALEYLNNHNYIHNAIKCNHICINENHDAILLHPQITPWDQTFSEHVAAIRKKTTCAYQSKQQNDKSLENDLFNLGFVWYTVLTNNLSYYNYDLDAAKEANKKGKLIPPHEINSIIPKKIENIILQTIFPDEDVRISSPQEFIGALSNNSQELNKYHDSFAYTAKKIMAGEFSNRSNNNEEISLNNNVHKEYTYNNNIHKRKSKEINKILKYLKYFVLLVAIIWIIYSIYFYNFGYCDFQRSYPYYPSNIKRINTEKKSDEYRKNFDYRTNPSRKKIYRDKELKDAEDERKKFENNYKNNSDWLDDIE